ncbi:thioesterase [Lysinibacillus sphaericus]|uniref:Thioesterase n=1 Tax=Lysinibacillus sphaericus TaxID=1421 RepID=A0A544V0Z5_LYSSH|nr:thioesterase domain-containing protein [Lysinibacillus sp. SDF0037]TQR39693.1 thioesterase [Lysinibacillus sp. SDF0037]
MILFCIPYAGGPETIYYKWKNYLDASIKLEPIELKGRGNRYNEGFYTCFDEAVDDIFLNIKDKITHHEYAIFGHSLGSRLAYELYYKICDKNLAKPKHIFFSGNNAPSVMKEKKELHKLSDVEFMKEIIKLGGTPKELLENEELLQFVLPTLRSDIKINENYVYKERKEKIECDTTVFSGKEDIPLKGILKWKSHCSQDFRIHMMEGNHFFINNNIGSITEIINFELNKHINKEDQYVIRRG